MRALISGLGSVGIGLLLSWAGLAFDKQALLIAGIIITAVAASAWLWAWGTGHIISPARTSGDTHTPSINQPAQTSVTERDRVIATMAAAIRSADEALARRSEGNAERVIPILQAAILSAQIQFGLPEFAVNSAGSYRQIAHFLRDYLVKTLPLIREGHDARAINVAQGYLATGFAW